MLTRRELALTRREVLMGAIGVTAIGSVGLSQDHLVPVGKDLDGTIRPIKELSYKAPEPPRLRKIYKILGDHETWVPSESCELKDVRKGDHLVIVEYSGW